MQQTGPSLESSVMQNFAHDREFSIIFYLAATAALILRLQLLVLGIRSLTTYSQVFLAPKCHILLWSQDRVTAGNILRPELPLCFEKGDKDVVITPETMLRDWSQSIFWQSKNPNAILEFHISESRLLIQTQQSAPGFWMVPQGEAQSSYGARKWGGGGRQGEPPNLLQ